MIRPTRPPASGAVARHYDELDRFYRELWGEDLHHGLWRRGDEEVAEATQSLTRLVAEHADIGHGDRVCDVGCGYGGPARFLADRYGARVVGLTLSEVQHRHAVARAAGDRRTRFLLGDWLRNPFAPARFDAVIAIESASHMAEKSSFFRECRRVLRSGGRLVVAAWMASEDPARWQRRHLLEAICDEGRLPGLGTEAEYRRWMEEAGLRLVRFEDRSRGVQRTWTLCIRRLGKRVLKDPAAWRYLLDPEATERGFALTMARIWLAYRTGALRYGIFVARVP